MPSRSACLVGALAVLVFASAAHAKVNSVVVRNDDSRATADFKFKVVAGPSADDAAAKATFAIVDGRGDSNGGDLDQLHDGRVPAIADQPRDNFFFAAGSEGGRLLVDLGSVIGVEQVNTYSWHSDTRGPQVYKLYASDGAAQGFESRPKHETDPAKAGWKLVADIDTRPAEGEGEDGGQYAVSTFDSNGRLGRFRYLLFDISRTESADPFGNTFYSEIDVVTGNLPGVADGTGKESGVFTLEAGNGEYQITINTAAAPDLGEWAQKELAPVVQQWYPKLVEMLPSQGYAAPKSFSITFSPEFQGVAAAGGTRISCAAVWFRRNLEGEAKGAIIHEMVHVVQQYGRARRTNPNATRPPGWLVEGIADYIRWFLYEPQTRGAELTQRNLSQARYDASYRISGNFLNWVTHKYDREIVKKLNANLREGKYTEDLWKDATGKAVAELGDEWKLAMTSKLAGEADAAPPAVAAVPANNKASGDGEVNLLVEDEKTAGWKLLFDGKSLDGWHSFGRKDVRPGWKVKDGVLVCVDPHDAGDLCTNDQFESFELRLEYNISAGGNSGIMYHVTDQASNAWATGPEFQLEDNAKAPDPIRCGWLYALYQPPNDPKTNKPLDATKPAGQWNQVRLLITPEKCEHEINGAKYFDYVLGSDEFKQRVAKSKFSSMPLFAKAPKGYVALQGDHGEISFRNIKIRPVEAKK